jgi:hypothetical protein
MVAPKKVDEISSSLTDARKEAGEEIEDTGSTCAGPTSLSSSTKSILGNGLLRERSSFDRSITLGT